MNEMSGMRRPTIRDVAREAGVSHMTVSRVLRGLRVVRKETEEMVMTAVEKTGYRPDPALSALAMYRSKGGGMGGGNGLAFLDCDGTDFSKSMCKGLEAEAVLHGYGVERHRLPESEAGQKRLGRMLYHRGVRGLLFGPSDGEKEFKGWDWGNFAAVSLGALAHRPALHAVAMDYFHGAFSACRMLWEKGCRRIGFAVDPRLEVRTGHRWLGGYAAAMEGGGMLDYRGRWPDERAIRDWMRRSGLDGLLTIHAELLAVWRGSKDCFILLNDNSGEACRELSHLSLDPARIGAEGVRFLHPLLLRREYGLPAEPKMMALKGTWVERVGLAVDGR